jgi:two-component system response regulator YesN
MIRIVIVDDNRITAQAIERAPIWKENNIEIVGTAFNGKQALKLLDEDIHVLVTDIRMPVMDGLELTSLAKQKYPNLQVIFISAYTEFEYAQSALKLKVFDYISKPVDYSLLMEKILAAYDAESKKREVNNLLAMYQNLVQMMREILLDVPNQKELIHEALSLFERLPKLNEQEAQVEINAYATRLSKQNLKAFSNNDDKQFDVIYRICNAIQTVCVEKNSGLAEVSRKVYLSPNYVSAIFKQYTGETVTQRMSRVRLDIAKSLLQNPALKIYEVSDKVGYANPYYFSVWFKKMSGISPSDYRRSHCIDQLDDK